jgi:very-short-patch-repair endonuclease
MAAVLAAGPGRRAELPLSGRAVAHARHGAGADRRERAAISRAIENHRKNGETVLRSTLERRFVSLIEAHDLPRPRINRGTDHGELDARWPEQRLIVECDGLAVHGTRGAFEADRARERELVVAGWRVVRVRWRRLIDDAEVVARQLAALLG